MSTDRQFAVSGNWALASDGIQWILCRRRGIKGGQTPGWTPLSFVRSTKDILARCMHEKGCPATDAAKLLANLPATFDEWHQQRPLEPDTADSTAALAGEQGPTPKPHGTPLNSPTGHAHPLQVGTQLWGRAPLLETGLV